MNSWDFDRSSGQGVVKAVVLGLKRSELDLGGLVKLLTTVKPDEQN